MGEAVLVNPLQQARAKFAMDGKGAVHHRTTDRVHLGRNGCDPVVLVVHPSCPS